MRAKLTSMTGRTTLLARGFSTGHATVTWVSYYAFKMSRRLYPQTVNEWGPYLPVNIIISVTHPHESCAGQIGEPASELRRDIMQPPIRGGSHQHLVSKDSDFSS